MKFISNNFKKSFIITGNHEYYNKTKTIEEIDAFLSKYFEQFKNISFLNLLGSLVYRATTFDDR